MGTETALEFLIELVDDAKERFRRDGFFQRADLVDAFLRAGPVVFQQVLHGTVALGVPGFHSGSRDATGDVHALTRR